MLKQVESLINHGFTKMVLEADAGAERTHHFYQHIGLKDLGNIKQDISEYVEGEHMVFKYYGTKDLLQFRNCLHSLIENDKRRKLKNRKMENDERNITKPYI